MPFSRSACRASNSASCAFERLPSARRGAARLTTLGFAPALAAAFARRRLTAFLAAATSAFLSAVIAFVHRRPSPALCFFFADAALFVSLLDVICFAFLFPGVFLFAAPGHW